MLQGINPPSVKLIAGMKDGWVSVPGLVVMSGCCWTDWWFSVWWEQAERDQRPGAGDSWSWRDLSDSAPWMSWMFPWSRSSDCYHPWSGPGITSADECQINWCNARKPANQCENYLEFVANFCRNNPQSSCPRSRNIYTVMDRIAETRSCKNIWKLICGSWLIVLVRGESKLFWWKLFIFPFLPSLVLPLLFSNTYNTSVKCLINSVSYWPLKVISLF